MIAIVDYEMGNHRSVQKAVNRLGYECVITNNPDVLAASQKLILPGVGHFKRGIENLKRLCLIETLNNLVIHEYKPVMGICLGMQLMTSFSEEGNCSGLNWINANTYQFKLNKLKVPHIGWNTIEIIKNPELFNNIDSNDEFYFVHSFYVKCELPEDRLFRSNYGIDFDSGFLHENIMGVQFHPEKSHNSGLKLLKIFLNKQ